MRFTRPRDQHETPRTSADRTRPDRVRTDLTCDTGGCHGTGACLHTGTCHHTGGCHQTSADDPSLLTLYAIAKAWSLAFWRTPAQAHELAVAILEET